MRRKIIVQAISPRLRQGLEPRGTGLVERLQANPIRQEELYVAPVEEMISVLLFEFPGLNKIALPLDAIDHIHNNWFLETDQCPQ
jgi:hypothetical protein